MIGILQIVIAIATILIIVLVLARLAIRSKYFAFHRLFEQGYILTSENRKTICFENYMEARSYQERAKEHGVEYSIYMVSNGRIGKLV
ncbi:MAG TPA: hypothetical protein PLF99_03905 [Tenuifilaceae bacterium]|nr:hypothetical protein [Tenuifilaceae bacterium]